MVSRVARKPIEVPSGVNLEINEGMLYAKGKLGELSHHIPTGVKAVFENEKLRFEIVETSRYSKKLNISVGTTHSLAKNMIEGVSQGFSRGLTLVGVGYRAEVKGKMLKLTVGYSHPVEMLVPDGLTVKTEKPTEILVTGNNKQKVSQFAAKIRAIRSPEPYKGKGIRYHNEVIKKKEVKKK